MCPPHKRTIIPGMAKLTGKQIKELAKSIIASTPGGIRYSVLVNAIAEQNPELSKKTIQWQVWDLHKEFPNEVSKPSPGLFTSVTSSQDGVPSFGSTEQIAPNTGIKVREADFYGPFAEWLKELDEVTEVSVLGGAGMKSKWGTPDVVGTYKNMPGNVIKFPIEIVSAEIKIDPQAPVVAFGQAIAYRLFSTKTYIAMPKTLVKEDQDRLESLCMLFGVGLVLFELNKDAPDFNIRVRAQRFSPDMFYANEFADRLKQLHENKFCELFG